MSTSSISSSASTEPFEHASSPADAASVGLEAQLFGVLDEGPVRIDVAGHPRVFAALYADAELGVYTALRTFGHNRFLNLEHHLQRTRASMARFGIQRELDVRRLRAALHEVCTAWPGEDMRVRIDILPEPAPQLSASAYDLIALAAFEPPPPQRYERGVSLVCTTSLRREDPLTKSADFAARRAAVLSIHPHAEDCLLVEDDGLVLEGTNSNFYAVVDGVLRTAGEGVLEGVTRAIVLDLARRAGYPVELKAPTLDELRGASEAAISSASRGIMPVVRVDGRAVGNGRPGPLIGALAEAYADYLERSTRCAM